MRYREERPYLRDIAKNSWLLYGIDENGQLFIFGAMKLINSYVKIKCCISCPSNLFICRLSVLVSFFSYIVVKTLQNVLNVSVIIPNGNFVHTFVRTVRL